MGWRSEEIKQECLRDWSGWFGRGTRHTFARSMKIVEATGLTLPLVTAFLEAESSLDFTRKWKLEVPKLAERIPVGAVLMQSELELLYILLLGCTYKQRMIGPQVLEWFSFLRMYIWGRARGVKSYEVTPESIDRVLRGVASRRWTLNESIARMGLKKLPNRLCPARKIHLEFAVVDTLYRILYSMRKDAAPCGILPGFFKLVIRAYRQDLEYRRVGPVTVRFLELAVKWMELSEDPS